MYQLHHAIAVTLDTATTAIGNASDAGPAGLVTLGAFVLAAVLAPVAIALVWRNR